MFYSDLLILFLATSFFLKLLVPIQLLCFGFLALAHRIKESKNPWGSIVQSHMNPVLFLSSPIDHGSRRPSRLSLLEGRVVDSLES